MTTTEEIEPVGHAKQQADLLCKVLREVLTELGHDPTDVQVSAVVTRVLRNVR